MTRSRMPAPAQSLKRKLHIIRKGILVELFTHRFVKKFLGTPNSEMIPRFTLMLWTIECINACIPKPTHFSCLWATFVDSP